MAENIPNMPSGAVPPKPGESAKVQPKKETVRINLPPKPTAAPTVRLPAPPSAGVAVPAAASAAPASVNVTNVVTPAAPAAPRTVGTAPTVVAAPAVAVAPASRPVSGPAPVRTVVRSTASGLDTGLAVVAALLAIGVLVHLLKLSMG